MLKKTVLVLLLSLFAQVQLHADTAKELESLDAYFSGVSWQQATAPREIAVSFEECTKIHACELQNVLVSAQLSQPESFEVLTAFKNKKPHHRAVLTKAQYEQNSGNWVRLDIATLNSFGFAVEIQSVEDTTFEVKLNDQPIVAPAKKVIATGMNGSGQKLDIIYTVTNAIAGYGAMVGRVQGQAAPMAVVRTRLVESITIKN
jgi:hypothetical protein